MHNFGAPIFIAGLAGSAEIITGDNQITSEDNRGLMLRCIIFVHKKRGIRIAWWIRGGLDATTSIEVIRKIR